MFEQLQAQAGLLEPTEQIFCVDFDNGDRVYFTPQERFSGVTRPIQNASGSAPYLLDYYFKAGAVMIATGETKEDADLRTHEAMEYGSFLHGIYAEFVRHGNQYDPFHLPEAVEGFFFSHSVQYNLNAWVKKAKRHLSSFCQWVHDFQIEFLAVELPVVVRTLPDEHGNPVKFQIGSRIDIVCRAGNPGKEGGTLWIVDVKSGEKSYKKILDYEYQLSFYRQMLLANFPEFQEDDIRQYNWSPKQWNARSRTFYHFEERRNTPFPILAGIVNKFWYEHGDTFLTPNVLTFSEKPFTPEDQNFCYQTQEDAIQEYLKQEGLV